MGLKEGTLNQGNDATGKRGKERGKRGKEEIGADVGERKKGRKKGKKKRKKERERGGPLPSVSPGDGRRGESAENFEKKKFDPKKKGYGTGGGTNNRNRRTLTKDNRRGMGDNGP